MSMPQTIVAFVAELMFQMRIESTAQYLGYQIQWFESTQSLEEVSEDLRLMLGLEGILIDKLTRLSPNLLIFDLGNEDIPWKKWIPALKTIPATRWIPLICFGSHVDTVSIQAARQAGADVVVARSRFMTALPELIQKYAQSTDVELFAEICAKPLHPKAIQGLELFNQGDYFGAHEWLEEAWMEDRSTGRDLYRGVLQVAVAYYQIRLDNFRGAVKMFQRARHWLDPLPDTCRGIDIAQIRRNTNAVYDQVLALGPTHLNELDPALLKPILWRLP